MLPANCWNLARRRDHGTETVRSAGSALRRRIFSSLTGKVVWGGYIFG